MNTAIETSDIQALVFSGHGRFPHSLVVGLWVEDAPAARASGRKWVDHEISFGLSRGERTRAFQFLVTAAGLAALGLPEPRLAGLDTGFLEGIVGAQRSRALGDQGPNSPVGWSWNDRGLHALGLFYGSEIETVVQDCRRLFSSTAGWRVVFEQPICSPADRREPFGFRDGISVPRINTSEGGQPDGPELIAPGEIVLGLRNAAGTQLPPPVLGINGTYVAVRQIEQDVQAFWDFWRRQGKNDEQAVWLASKAFGRWPNGMPMESVSPEPQPVASEPKITGSLAFASDARGLRCPFGAHIRRANPRDSLDDDPAASLAIVADHRILRRGRMYGSPAPASWYPSGITLPALDSKDRTGTDTRGIVFIALCSDLGRQFEFIQQTWLNNPKFMDLNDESDPIVAGAGVPSDSRRFSVPSDPVRRRIHDLPRWTTVKAGGYFLMPGRKALEAIFGI